MAKTLSGEYVFGVKPPTLIAGAAQVAAWLGVEL